MTINSFFAERSRRSSPLSAHNLAKSRSDTRRPDCRVTSNGITSAALRRFSRRDRSGWILIPTSRSATFLHSAILREFSHAGKRRRHVRAICFSSSGPGISWDGFPGDHALHRHTCRSAKESGEFIEASFRVPLAMPVRNEGVARHVRQRPMANEVRSLTWPISSLHQPPIVERSHGGLQAVF